MLDRAESGRDAPRGVELRAMALPVVERERPTIVAALL